MFKKCITEEQIIEIENMSKKHFDAVVAYGGDMYRQGIFKGAIIATAGIATGATSSIVWRIIKNKRKKTQKNEES